MSRSCSSACFGEGEDDTDRETCAYADLELRVVDADSNVAERVIAGSVENADAQTSVTATR